MLENPGSAFPCRKHNNPCSNARLLFQSGVLEEMDGVLRGSVFGSVLDLDTLNIELSPDVMIPGVAVASSRATPLAGTKPRWQ